MRRSSASAAVGSAAAGFFFSELSATNPRSSLRTSGGSSMPAQQRPEFGQAAGVEDVSARRPAAARHPDPPLYPVERAQEVGVGRHDEPRALLERQLDVAVVQVQPFELAVDLEGHAGGSGGGHHIVHADTE